MRTEVGGRWLRGAGWLLVVVVVLWLAQVEVEPAVAAGRNWTVPPAPPVLINPDFECSDGYVPGKNPNDEETLIPQGWTVLYRSGSPIVSSTRQFYAKVCEEHDRGAFIERLHQWDSLLVRSEDIETPPEPGKPFDVVIYQRVPALLGGTYSLSAWMVTLCGNKGEPFDCPSGYYMAKAVAIDPLGGTDPDAPHLEWVENRLNFVDEAGKRLGWQNLRTSTVALGDTITVFARMTSPFQWHGNLGFMDAFSLVRGPLAALDKLPDTAVKGEALPLTWQARQSEDVAALADGNYDLMIDVQARLLPNGEWRDLAVGAAAEDGQVTFTPRCADVRYALRLRARTEQPDGEPGAYPNHRYNGVWSAPQTVAVVRPPSASALPAELGAFNLYLPSLMETVDCSP